MKKLLSACLVPLCIPAACWAYKPAPQYSYRKFSADRQFVFVMISPLSLEEDGKRCNQEAAEEIREIRRRYPTSGLYRNDSSQEPLWIVDWYTRARITVVSDGIHLIHTEGVVAMRDEVVAITFYKRGKAFKSYTLRNLGDAPESLPKVVGPVSPSWWTGSRRGISTTQGELTRSSPAGAGATSSTWPRGLSSPRRL